MVALAAIIAAVSLAPATLLDARIAHATGQWARLIDTEGTVWHGRGTMVMATTRIPVAWEIDIRPLLEGVVRVRVRSGTGAATPRATIAFRTDGVALRDVDVTIPAGALAALLDRTAAGSVVGDVSVLADDLELGAGRQRGDARLAWRGAGIAAIVGPAMLDLGDVRSTLSANGEALAGPLANEGGDLALVGEWKMHPRDGLSLALRLTPRRTDAAKLKAALAAVATADGDGWRVDWRVPFR